MSVNWEEVKRAIEIQYRTSLCPFDQAVKVVVEDLCLFLVMYELPVVLYVNQRTIPESETHSEASTDSEWSTWKM